MTDEETIARDLGEILGENFLFWDKVICGVSLEQTASNPIFKVQARQIVDAYLNERPQLTGEWKRNEKGERIDPLTLLPIGKFL